MSEDTKQPSDSGSVASHCSHAEPWRVVRDRNNHWGMIEVVGSNILTIQGFTVATNVSPHEASLIERDAQLIAAAPEMLAALEAIVGEAGFEGLPESKQEQIYSAIEKATNQVV